MDSQTPGVEIIGVHPELEQHVLGLLEVGDFSEIEPALRSAPRFISLLVADFSGSTGDDLTRLARRMIDTGSRSFCVWGRHCRTAHVTFDDACCDHDILIPTMDHGDSPIEAAIWYALNCADPGDPPCSATIAMCVNEPEAANTIRLALANAAMFCEKHGPAG